MVVAVAVVLALVVAGDTTLDRCRAESQALNTGKAIATCQAAANEPQLGKAEKVEALKLLGMALMVESETDLAEDAFKKMLTLDDTATLGADAGPNVQKVYERAQQEVRDEKKAKAAAAAAQPQPLPHDDASATHDGKTPGGAGLPAVTPAISWSLVGVGAGVAIASSVLAGGAIYDRYYNRVPCGPAGAACIPFAPMLFGIYKAEDREKFRTDAGAWIGGGITVAVVGALAAGAGGALLALAPDPALTTTTPATTTPATTTPATTTPATN